MPFRTPDRGAALGPTRTTVLRLALVSALSLVPAVVADAQQVEREVLLAIDESRGVIELDARLRAELGLFPEINGFISASVFRTESGGYVLEIAYNDQGVLARERRRLSADELAALRAELQARLIALGRERVVDRSGRAGLILGQAVVGLAYHGWVVPTVLDIDSDRGQVAAYLLTAGSSFLVPWTITRDLSVTVAQRDAAFWGASRGIVYGLLLGSALAPEDSGAPFEEDDAAHRVRVGTGSLLSALGSFAGYHAASLADQDDGTVALWSAAADFGLASAFGASYALGLYDDDEQVGCDDCSDIEQRGGNAVTFGLGLLGLVGAWRWGDAESYTVGDARALRSFGLLGAHAVLPAAFEAFEDESGEGEGKKIVGSALLGTWTALYLGNRALRRTSLSGGDGLLVLAGHAAGGLVSLGVTYLLDGGERGSETVYLATSAAGAALGSLLTFNAVRGGEPRPGAPEQSAMRRDLDRELTARSTRGVSVSFDPSGLLLPVLERVGARSSAALPRSASLLTLRF